MNMEDFKEERNREFNEEYDNIDESTICDCGNYKSTEEKICNSCKRETIEKFLELLRSFSEEELEYLNDELDGEYLPDFIEED